MSDGSCRFSVKQDKVTLMHNHLIKDLNYTINNPDTLSAGYTSTPTLNNRDNYYNHVITMMAYNEISQLALPMNSTKRIAYRANGNLNSTTPITAAWREIPYADEVPFLNSDGTISGTSNRTQELLTTHLGDMRGSTIGKIKEEINKVYNLSQGGIMVISLLINVNDFLTHITSDSYTTINEGTKYTIILSGNHKYQKGYALGEIKELGSMRSFYFRINNGYYEYLGESVTMDAVQKAIEAEFKKRNL